MSSHSHRVRLAAFDLDGTLSLGPTICDWPSRLGKRFAVEWFARRRGRRLDRHRPRADLREIAQRIVAA